MRDRRKRDLDNFLKGALDSLTGTGVIEDDSQISRIEADKCDCRDCPTSFFLLVRELEINDESHDFTYKTDTPIARGDTGGTTCTTPDEETRECPVQVETPSGLSVS